MGLGIPTFEKRRPILMEHKDGKREEQLKLELEEARISYELKNEVSDLGKLKLDYWKQQNQKNQGALQNKAFGGSKR